MAIKFEKIKAGMTLYQRVRRRMGNTTMSGLCEYGVEIVSVDTAKRRALVKWNGNGVETYFERDLTRLYDWSMYDESVAELRRGMIDNVIGVRKKKKKAKSTEVTR